jgi:hypothetical protein
MEISHFNYIDRVDDEVLIEYKLPDPDTACFRNVNHFSLYIDVIQFLKENNYPIEKPLQFYKKLFKDINKKNIFSSSYIVFLVYDLLKNANTIDKDTSVKLLNTLLIYNSFFTSMFLKKSQIHKLDYFLLDNDKCNIDIWSKLNANFQIEALHDLSLEFENNLESNCECLNWVLSNSSIYHQKREITKQKSNFVFLPIPKDIDFYPPPPILPWVLHPSEIYKLQPYPPQVPYAIHYQNCWRWFYLIKGLFKFAYGAIYNINNSKFVTFNFDIDLIDSYIHCLDNGKFKDYIKYLNEEIINDEVFIENKEKSDIISAIYLLEKKWENHFNSPINPKKPAHHLNNNITGTIINRKVFLQQKLKNSLEIYEFLDVNNPFEEFKTVLLEGKGMLEFNNTNFLYEPYNLLHAIFKLWKKEKWLPYSTKDIDIKYYTGGKKDENMYKHKDSKIRHINKQNVDDGYDPILKIKVDKLKQLLNNL